MENHENINEPVDIDDHFESEEEEQFYNSWEEYFLDSCRHGCVNKRLGGT